MKRDEHTAVPFPETAIEYLLDLQYTIPSESATRRSAISVFDNGRLHFIFNGN